MRSRFPRTLLAIALLAPLAGACVATRGDVDYLSEEHRRIEARQSEIEARMATLEENIQRLLQEMRADFRAELGTVRQGLNALEGAVRGTESRIEQMRRQSAAPPPAVEDPADTTAAAIGEIDQVALYNAAITDYQRRRLDLARQGFEEYLRLFPDGLSAPDAQYWLGAVAYDEERFGDAVGELRLVVERYPDSSKAPLALRKIGDAHRAMGEPDRARAAYREVVQRYPNSAEAEGARRELGP